LALLFCGNREVFYSGPYHAPALSLWDYNRYIFAASIPDSWLHDNQTANVHETLPEALAGDNVGINIRGVGKKDIARGDVICEAARPSNVVEEFIATVTVINHPTVLAKGYTPVFHVHTAQVPCQFVELIEQIDPRSGEVIKKSPDFLKTSGMVRAT